MKIFKSKEYKNTIFIEGKSENGKVLALFINEQINHGSWAIYSANKDLIHKIIGCNIFHNKIFDKYKYGYICEKRYYKLHSLNAGKIGILKLI